jgi:epoxyqueuosine reductase QueG
MDMNRWPNKKIWDVSHKLVAVQAGLGHTGINRNVIHPKYGNYIVLDSILIDAELDSYSLLTTTLVTSIKQIETALLVYCRLANRG